MNDPKALTRQINLSFITQPFGAKARLSNLLSWNSGNITHLIHGRHMTNYKFKRIEEVLGFNKGDLDRELDFDDCPASVWKALGTLDPKHHDTTHIGHFTNSFHDEVLAAEPKTKGNNRKRRTGYSWNQELKSHSEPVKGSQENKQDQSSTSSAENQEPVQMDLCVGEITVDNLNPDLSDVKEPSLESSSNDYKQTLSEDEISHSFRAAMLDSKADSSKDAVTKSLAKAFSDASDLGLFDSIVELVSESIAEAIVNRTADKIQEKIKKTIVSIR